MSLTGLAYVVYRLAEAAGVDEVLIEAQRERARRDIGAAESENGSVELRHLEDYLEKNLDSCSARLLEPGYLYELADHFDRLDEFEEYSLEEVCGFKSVREYLSD